MVTKTEAPISVVLECELLEVVYIKLGRVLISPSIALTCSLRLYCATLALILETRQEILIENLELGVHFGWMLQ